MSRIIFPKNYFTREIDKGEFSLFRADDAGKKTHEGFNCNMENGIATLNLTLPDPCTVGDVLDFEAAVSDRTLIEPFTNRFRLTVLEKAEKKKSDESSRRKPPSKEKGTDREVSTMIQPPRPTKVYEDPKEGRKCWTDMDPEFNKYSALRIIDTGESQ